MSASGIEKVQLYKDLNLPPLPPPTMVDIMEAYQELKKAYQKKALNPITPADFAAKNKLVRAKAAYDLLNVGGRVPDRFTRFYRLSVRELLDLYYNGGSKPTFEIESIQSIGCICKRQCPACNASQPQRACERCMNKGWVHHCNECKGRGTRNLFQVQRYNLGDLSAEYFWTDPRGEKIHLEITPLNGLSVRGKELWYDYRLSLTEVVNNGLIIPTITVDLGKTKKRIDFKNVKKLSGNIQVPLDEAEAIPGVSTLNIALTPVTGPELEE